MPDQSRGPEDFPQFRIVSRSGKEIGSVAQWKRLCTRKGQWKEGRSVTELAKSFFRTGCASLPLEIDNLLKSHPQTASIRFRTCIPEAVTRLDKFRGGQRNHDAILIDDEPGLTSLAGIEAKVDEPFGKIVSSRLVAASPNARTRVQQLSSGLFGRFDSATAKLRYQLVHVTAGTLIEAKRRGARKAIFVVDEFVSRESSERARRENRIDWASFLNALGVPSDNLLPGILLGPLRVPGGRFVPGDVPLFVGKTVNVL